MNTNIRNFRQKYITNMRPVFNRQALYTDTTESYVVPADPEPYSRVKIRFRTARNNVDNVYLEHEDVSIRMYKLENGELFDIYEQTVFIEDRTYTYHFKIQSGGIECFYDCRSTVSSPDAGCNFAIYPGFQTPSWMKGAVMYQIYTDRFCNGDPTNDVLDREYYYLGDYVQRIPREQWDKYPAHMGVREFYGGDLQGVLDKLDYLKDLGVEVIYFNPLFVSPSNHKYDTQDYDNIDPHFGPLVVDEGEVLAPGDTENAHAQKYRCRVTDKRNLESANLLFAKVVEEAHNRGIRVIIDGVFNHCGSFNKWLDREKIYDGREGYIKGAFVSADSPYQDYFYFRDRRRESWPDNTSYDGWWGHDTLPKLNYEYSETLCQYICHIAEKWLLPPYNADGWRLDVAADLGSNPEANHRFWKLFRKCVKKVKPDAVIIAEHYGNPSDWLHGDEWDTIMNYDAFMEPLSWFFTGMEKHSDMFRYDFLGNAGMFWDAMIYNGRRLPWSAGMISMNELSNHDHSRFLTRTNHMVGRCDKLGSENASVGVNPAVMREAVTVQFTWTGAPTIYYGDEAGVCGFTDPDNRRTYPWGHEDRMMIDFHKAVIHIHKTCPELRKGSLKNTGSGTNYLTYGRFLKEAQTLVLINNNDHEIELDIDVWYLGVPKESSMRRILLSTAESFTTESAQLPVNGGRSHVKMPAYSAQIYRHTTET
ncbi:MAG: glycoside hydrolase family 13 protein [Lachnospiraceae bacterium]|nr:glycoside hydrolase family 13 protein [Lachnospiraceae bacterium]